ISYKNLIGLGNEKEQLEQLYSILNITIIQTAPIELSLIQDQLQLFLMSPEENLKKWHIAYSWGFHYHFLEDEKHHALLFIKFQTDFFCQYCLENGHPAPKCIQLHDNSLKATFYKHENKFIYKNIFDFVISEFY
ncbi:1482_t:CDS:2, partial [Gigaspora margarita]